VRRPNDGGIAKVGAGWSEAGDERSGSSWRRSDCPVAVWPMRQRTGEAMMLKRAGFSALAVASAMMLTSLPVAAVPIISVGSYATPTSTDPFLVPILITGAVQLTSWDFDLTYDPTDLQINDPAALDPEGLGRPITEGDFFSAGAPFNLLVPGVIDLDPATLAQTGLLFGVHGAYGGFSPAPSGDGILVYIEFVKTPAGSGDSTIRIVSQSVTTSAVPEPTMLALLAGALSMLLGMWRPARFAVRQGP
jgi:hypothetical protein